MKHALRISKITKRITPKGMRKITVDGIIYFYKIDNYATGVNILDVDRKPFYSYYTGYECTWTPKYVADIIKQVVKGEIVKI